MKRFLLSLLALTSCAFGVEWSPSADRLPAAGTWQAAGVPGGIPNRTTIYDDGNMNGLTDSLEEIDNTGATDVSAAIQTALLNCPNGEVVKLGPGTFRCNSTLAIGYSKHCTLRGTLGATRQQRLTTIDTRSSIGVQLGTNYTFDATPISVVVASLTKGATSIQVADSTPLTVGQVVILSMGNDPTIPVFNVYPFTPSGLQQQVVKITGKPDGTHYSIEAPGLHGDYTTAPSATLGTDSNNFGFGSGSSVEDIHIDGSLQSPLGLGSGVQMDSSYGSWCLNVKVTGVLTYAFAPFYTLRCEVRECDSGASDPTVHTASGHFASGCTSFLYIDNIVRDNAWMLLQQGPNSGNVWAYNLFVHQVEHVGTVNNNHGPWVQYALYEGNLCSFFHSDGYFGGAGYQTYFRNWTFGADLDYGSPGIAGIYSRRGDRFNNIWFNHLGRTGNVGGVGFGSPNLSNSNDIVPGHTSRMCVASLSTRTDATSGTITAPSGHGVTTGATIDVLWTVEESSYYISKVRRGVTVGTVSGTSIPISGGLGDDLPAQDSVMYVPTANSALYNWWQDWNTSTNTPWKWQGELTTRTNDTAGVVTLDAGLVTGFSANLANAFNSQRGMQWGAGLNRSIIVTNVTGDEVTFDTASGAIPTVGTVVELTPSNFGFQ